MIVPGTHVKVIDNSGVVQAKCIHVVRDKVAHIGDMVVVVAGKVAMNSKIKQGDILRGVVVRTKVDSDYSKFNIFPEEYFMKSKSRSVEIPGDQPRKSVKRSKVGSKQSIGTYRERHTDNSIVLVKVVSGEVLPIGTRVKGPVGDRLRQQGGFSKIIAIVE